MFVNIIPEMLVIVKGLDYICHKCKMIISGHEINYETMPSNIAVHGLSPDSEIPKCPHCGTLAVLGMEEVKYSSMEKQLTEMDEDTITEYIDDLCADNLDALDSIKSLQ